MVMRYKDCRSTMCGYSCISLEETAPFLFSTLLEPNQFYIEFSIKNIYRVPTEVNKTLRWSFILTYEVFPCFIRVWIIFYYLK